jgi:hypothetical protein
MLRAMLVGLLLCGCEGEPLNFPFGHADTGGTTADAAADQTPAIPDSGADAGMPVPDVPVAALDVPADVPPDTFVCHDGARGCLGAELALCIDGAWSPVGGGACPFGCDAGACLECAAGDHRCQMPGSTDVLRVCVAGHWTDVDCPYGCDATRSVCADCFNGQLRCVAQEPPPESPTAHWRWEECVDRAWFVRRYCGACACGTYGDGLAGISCGGGGADLPADLHCSSCSETAEAVVCAY